MMIWVAFARGVGNIGRGRNNKVPIDEAVSKYGHTGNYLFGSEADAQSFRHSFGGFVAVVQIGTLKRLTRECTRIRGKLSRTGYAQQKDEYRFKKDGETYTIGVVFHDGRLPDGRNASSSQILIIKREPRLTIVLKKERMLDETRLDSSHRIPWGVASSLMGDDATARSMHTLAGTERSALRIGRH